MNVAMKGIVKSFGANDVLKKVDFSLQSGEICALLGENGAGKSTLMNILGGVLRPDAGQILLDGKPVSFASPAQSLKAGIAFIHQELNLINDLPVYENMFIGREIISRTGLIDHREELRQTRELFQKLNIEIDPAVQVASLDASYKQITEISRALMMDASVIIMDEPTSSLTDPEIERVFDMLRSLKKRNVGVIFISHKLREVMEICDQYVVLRDGSVISAGAVKDTSVASLSHDMVGHDVRMDALKQGAACGEEVLRLEDLTLEPSYRHINMHVCAGEVLGVTGLLGDGRSEVFRTVFGDMGKYSGKIILSGKETAIRSIQHAMQLGIGYVPRNRKENAIIKDLDILDNGTIVTMKQLRRFGLISKVRQLASFSKQKEDLRIKMGKTSDPIGSLSGGNQQKVVLAKWLMAKPKLLVLDNPTQGVDVGAKEEIYDIILQLARQGVAVVVLSNEAQEIIRICGRALVMYHGDICGEVSGDTMTEDNIMRMATGG